MYNYYLFIYPNMSLPQHSASTIGLFLHKLYVCNVVQQVVDSVVALTRRRNLGALVDIRIIYFRSIAVWY